MHPNKAIATCAVALLAMVFSVRHGENGPQLLYKMDPADAEWMVIDPSEAGGPEGPGTLEFTAEDMPAGTPAGGWLNLQAVTNDVAWRRETAEKLRDHPFAPRF